MQLVALETKRQMKSRLELYKDNQLDLFKSHDLQKKLEPKTKNPRVIFYLNKKFWTKVSNCKFSIKTRCQKMNDDYDC